MMYFTVGAQNAITMKVGLKCIGLKPYHPKCNNCACQSKMENLSAQNVTTSRGFTTDGTEKETEIAFFSKLI